jgi:hypothetical protein
MKRKRIVIMLKNLSVATATIVLVAALGTASFAGNHGNTPGGGAAAAGSGNADRDRPAGDASDGSAASGGRSVDGSANADGARPTPTGRAKAAEVACLAANANSNLCVE